MSTLIVPLTSVAKIRPHANAEKLEIAEVLGWQVVIGKGNFKEGDPVFYIPPDAVLTPELSDKLGVTQYLSKGRVKQVRLRGEPSFGFVVPVREFYSEDGPTDAIGDNNWASRLGITKYEPPVKIGLSDAAPDRADFPKYTNLENMRNFPHLLQPGERVVVSEKIHGTNSRVGMIEGEFVAGSRGNVRKPPQAPGAESVGFEELYRHNIYWYPLSLLPVQELLKDIAAKYQGPVILYGEVFGPKIQSLHYGVKEGLGYMAFDLSVGGRFLDVREFFGLCATFGVPTVPIVDEIDFDLALVKALSSGESLVPGAGHIREGVVVKPVKERHDPKLGRVALKYLSDEYLFSKHGAEDTRDV